LALRALTVPRALATWCAVLSAFGTTLLFTSVDGRSWFAAHATAVFFTSLGFYLAATRRPAFFVGACIGAAALGRTAEGLAVPGLFLLLVGGATSPKRDMLRTALLLGAGVAPFALIQAGYDLLRWGNPLDIYGPQLH